MQQICYASRSTSVHPQILIDLRDILSEARNFNNNQVYGVLYYADGFFFQCLEGKTEILEHLLIKLKKDKRHHDIIFFNSKYIEKASFNDWSMKFVGRNSDVQHYLIEMGYSGFEPMNFTQSQVDQFVACLVESEQSEVELI